MTKARDTGEVLNTRGTAATANVQTSPTDTTAGALMAVGAFGLGSTERVLVTNLDTTTVSGIYGFSVGATGNPTPLEGSLLVFPRASASGGVRAIQQIFLSDGSQQSRTNNGGTWSAWKRTDPQAFGLGTGIENNPAFIGDVETINTTAFQRLSQVSSNIPVVDDGFITSKYRGANNISLTIEYDNGELWRKTKDGTWSAWQPVYTGANLNPNVFGVVGTNDLVGIGYAESARTAIMALPILSYSNPVSITNTGTFTVRSGAGFRSRGAGVTGAASSITSNRYFVVQFSGLSGMTAGEVCLITADSASSKITVNF